MFFHFLGAKHPFLFCYWANPPIVIQCAMPAPKAQIILRKDSTPEIDADWLENG
jgi:hypothetical protein